MNTSALSLDLNLQVLLFAVYSFLGWLLESAWRSLSRRRFVNAGFLFGPYVPIYGFGAMAATILMALVPNSNLLLRALSLGLVLTVLEYVTGYLFEKVFGLRLWDYSKNRFNLNGRVSLMYSLGWAILGLVCIYVISPVGTRWVRSLDDGFLASGSYVVLAVMVLDFCFSVASLAAFRNRLLALETRSLASYRRFRDAFPDLDAQVLRTLVPVLRAKVSALADHFHAAMTTEARNRAPLDCEYDTIVSDIVANSEFLRLRTFRHHQSSIFDHVQKVSYLSYLVCKRLNLDYESAARGGLLHDFFLYDWHNHDFPDLPKEKNHGFAHPQIALTTAKAHFALNDIEQDIILKHMWPMTVTPPRFAESWVVSFVDKYVATKEYLDAFTNVVGRRRAATRLGGARAEHGEEHASNESGSRAGRRRSPRAGARPRP